MPNGIYDPRAINALKSLGRLRPQAPQGQQAQLLSQLARQAAASRNRGTAPASVPGGPAPQQARQLQNQQASLQNSLTRPNLGA